MMKSFRWTRARGGLLVVLVALAPIVARADQPRIVVPHPSLALYDDTSAQRLKLNAEIAAASQAVSEDESQLSDVKKQLLGANVALLAAKTIYNKQDLTDAQSFLAGLAVIAAQEAVDELNTKKSDLESDLKADRERYNQLKRELSRLGSP